MLGRTGRWIREQIVFLIVVVGFAVAFGYMLFQPGHTVRGTFAIAVVALAGGVLRLVLPSAFVGMLAVRGRWFDAACLLLFGALILAVDIRLRH